jgi:opacity protein-like surface antigen
MAVFCRPAPFSSRAERHAATDRACSAPRHRIALLRFVLSVLLAFPAFAGSISVGAKIGVPLSNFVQTNGDIGGRPFRADLNRFILGPTFGVQLPHGLSIEFGAIYKRFTQHAGQVEVIAEIGTPYQVQTSPYSKTGRSWEFPLVGQYRFSCSAIRPYVEAGVSFNHLGGVFSPFRTLVTQSRILRPEGRSESRTGFAVGGGFQFKLPLVRLIPGVRYTRYGNTRPWLPTANSVDLVVGVTF